MGFSYLTHLFGTDYLASLKWKWNGDLPLTEDGPASKLLRWSRLSAQALAVIAFVVCIGCFVGGILAVRDAIEHLAH